MLWIIIFLILSGDFPFICANFNNHFNKLHPSKSKCVTCFKLFVSLFLWRRRSDAEELTSAWPRDVSRISSTHWIIKSNYMTSCFSLTRLRLVIKLNVVSVPFEWKKVVFFSPIFFLVNCNRIPICEAHFSSLSFRARSRLLGKKPRLQYTRNDASRWVTSADVLISSLNLEFVFCKGI